MSTSQNRLADDVEKLRSLNLQVHDWERGAIDSGPKMAKVLDDRFLFRRGDGSVNDKHDFVASLGEEGNTTHELIAEVVQIQVLATQALVEVYVYLDGQRRSRPVKGWFRNLRLWEKQSDGEWRCVFWFNKGLLDT